MGIAMQKHKARQICHTLWTLPWNASFPFTLNTNSIHFIVFIVKVVGIALTGIIIDLNLFLFLISIGIKKLHFNCIRFVNKFFDGFVPEQCLIELPIKLCSDTIMVVSESNLCPRLPLSFACINSTHHDAAVWKELCYPVLLPTFAHSLSLLACVHLPSFWAWQLCLLFPWESSLIGKVQ